MLPVLSLLVIGSGILGAVALREFALALLVGLITGSYSSIFIATPLLAMLQEREPKYRGARAARTPRGAELERLVLGGSPSGAPPRGGRRRSPVGAPAARRRADQPRRAATPQAVLTHPPRPRKKKRR